MGAHDCGSARVVARIESETVELKVATSIILCQEWWVQARVWSSPAAAYLSCLQRGITDLRHDDTTSSTIRSGFTPDSSLGYL